MNDRCESCGGDDDLATVQRIYVEVDEAGKPTGQRLADGIETWCVICRLTYPHQPIEAE